MVGARNSTLSLKGKGPLRALCSLGNQPIGSTTEFIFGQFDSVNPPFLVPTQILNGRTIGPVEFPIDPPFFGAVMILNSRTIGPVKLSIRIQPFSLNLALGHRVPAFWTFGPFVIPYALNIAEVGLDLNLFSGFENNLFA
jgi:hypothetical protein